MHPEVDELFYTRYQSMVSLFEQYAVEYGAQMRTTHYQQAVAALDTEFANLTRALDYCLESQQHFESASELYIALESYIRMRGYGENNVYWGATLREWALSLSSKIDVRLLNCVANAYNEMRDYEQAIPLFWQIIAAIQQDDTKQEALARAYNNIGVAYWMTGKLDDAVVFMDHALKIERELGHIRAVTIHLMNKAQILDRQDKFEESLAASEEAMRLIDQLDEPMLATQMSYVHAGRLLMNHRYLEAASAYQRAMLGYTVIQDDIGLAEARYGYALLCYRIGAGDEAKQLIEQCLQAFQQHRHPDIGRAYQLKQRIQEKFA